MDQPPPKAEPHPDPVQKPESKGGHDPDSNSMADKTDCDPPNGDASNRSFAVGSESQAEAPREESPIRNGSAKKSVHWSPDLVTDSRAFNNNSSNKVYLDGSNPYVTSSPSPSPSSFSFKETMGTVKNVLGRWGKKVGEATRKAEDLAGNTWQHLKTGPSFAESALGRIAQGTKVLAEGGYEKIFRQTFETVPEEQLLNSYACYLSTSAGPVMGILYVSTAKLAFCSDNPLSYTSDDQTKWSYYKVVIPLHQLKSVNPSSSRASSSEKYIQVISVDNHEFWYMGFLNYDGAVKHLQDSLQARDSQNK